MRTLVTFVALHAACCGGGTGAGAGTSAGTGSGVGSGAGGADGVAAGGGGEAPTGPICTALGTGGVRLELDFVAVDPPIRFDRSDRVHASSAGALDGIAEVLGRCPTARIEIRVAAAARGEAEAALRAARARAEAIRSALVERGIDAGRLVARGVARSGFLDGLSSDEATRWEMEIVRVDSVACPGG